ncbi:hypothetical protein MASR2M39_28700 [Ignavibacteriales bacterium]
MLEWQRQRKEEDNFQGACDDWAKAAESGYKQAQENIEKYCLEGNCMYVKSSSKERFSFSDQIIENVYVRE